MNDRLTRLQLIAEHYGGIPALAKKLEMRPDSLRSYFNRNVNLGNKTRDKLEKLGINMKWFDYGEGNMFLYENNTKSPAVKENITFYDATNLKTIKVISMPAHANVGSLVSFYDLPATYQPLQIGERPEKIIGIRVAGNSLSELGIIDGMIAFFEPVKNVYNGQIVVVILNGTILIKKYGKDSSGIIKLHSAHNGVPPIVCNEIDDKLEILGSFQGAYLYPF